MSTPSHTVSCFSINYIVVNCGIPSSLSNGQRRYSGTTFRSRVTYTCNAGYLRTAGSSSRTCQSNGQWSGTHPTCTRKSTLCHYIYSLHTDYKHTEELLVFLVCTQSIPFPKPSIVIKEYNLSMLFITCCSHILKH